MGKLTFSTGTFGSDFSLVSRIEFLIARGVTAIELSGGNFEKDWSTIVSSFDHVEFSLHNYFPPPEHPFVFNLASSDDGLRAASINLCKEGIRLTSEYGQNFFSFHAGFCFDPSPSSLGSELQSTSAVQETDAANDFFSRSLDEIVTFADQYKVMPVVENNVLTGNTKARWGKNSLLLTTAEDFGLFSERWGLGVGILLDVGHLKVSSSTLGLDFDSELSQSLPLASALHLHSNGGLEDQHLGITGGENWWPSIEARDDIPWTFEVVPEDIEETIRNLGNR